VMNVGKPYSSTLKPEKEKINIYYVNLINGLYIETFLDRESQPVISNPKPVTFSSNNPFFHHSMSCLGPITLRIRRREIGCRGKVNSKIKHAYATSLRPG